MLVFLDSATRTDVIAAHSSPVGVRRENVITALVAAFDDADVLMDLLDSDSDVLATVTFGQWSVSLETPRKFCTTGAVKGFVTVKAGAPVKAVFRTSEGTSIFECPAGVLSGVVQTTGSIDTALALDTATISFYANDTLDTVVEEPVEPPINLPSLDPGGTAQLPTVVTLTRNDGVAAGVEQVTLGLPLSVGVLTDLSMLRARINGTAVPIAVQAGLRWHWLDNSYRSVTVQLEVDITNDVDVVFDIAVGAPRRAGWPVLDGWVDSGHTDADGTTLLMPRVLPLHDPDYLAACGLLPPFAPPAEDDAANEGIWKSLTALNGGHGLLDATFPWARTATGGIDFDAWLFDRPGTLCKLSMQFRDPAKRRTLLRNAAISKRHYFGQVGDEQVTSVAAHRVPYWWGLKRKAEGSAFSYSTTMYQQCQAAKLMWALLGDDTQWSVEMLTTWAASMRNLPGSTPGHDVTVLGPVYNYPASWTERLAGIPSLFHLHAWEITGDATIRASLDQRVAYLRGMQQDERAYETAEGWPVSPGIFRHSWINHGGAGESPDYLGVLQDTYPAGTTEVRIRFRLSEHDIERWANKGFYIGGNGAFLPTDYVSEGDGIWRVTLDVPLKAQAGPGTSLSARANIDQAPLVEADQGFSPWMSVYIADYLWQQYCLLATPEIPEMLRRLGNAINARGFISVPNDDGTFTRDIWSYSASPGRGFNRDTNASYPLYLCSDIAPREVLYHGGFMDTHTEVFFPVALALLWETDAARRRKLRARCERVEYALFHDKAVHAPNPRRLLNWQHSAAPLRTWKFVEQGLD